MNAEQGGASAPRDRIAEPFTLSLLRTGMKLSQLYRNTKFALGIFYDWI